MVGFAARYLKALIAILIAMGVYVVTVARWIEPQNVNAARSTLVSRKLPDNQWWQALFTEGSWQTQNPKIIEAILFQKTALADMAKMMEPYKDSETVKEAFAAIQSINAIYAMEEGTTSMSETQVKQLTETVTSIRTAYVQ